MLEEAYETAEAIDCESDEMLCEELGDVMLQVMFHSRIAEEEGRFTVDDVYTGVCKKMIERHPHIFGEVKVNNVEDVLTNWDAIKQNSKNRETLREQLDGVCKALPALMLASKYANKCLKNGMEIETSLEIAQPTEGMIGKMLFDIAVIAKRNKIDPELALQKECELFLNKIEE
jgi:tetrapyrrole methylase family protein/MazG family protein